MFSCIKPECVYPLVPVNIDSFMRHNYQKTPVFIWRLNCCPLLCSFACVWLQLPVIRKHLNSFYGNVHLWAEVGGVRRLSGCWGRTPGGVLMFNGGVVKKKFRQTLNPREKETFYEKFRSTCGGASLRLMMDWGVDGVCPRGEAFFLMELSENKEEFS